MRTVIFIIMFITGLISRSFSQNVSGTVTANGTDNLLPGVNIKVKGTTIGMFTNKDGHYSLDVPSLRDTLVFSYVGYQTQKVPINGRTQINISLKSQSFTGKEVVVIGYGEKKRQNLTESVSTISAKQLQKSPALNVGNMLAGKATGLHITQRSGYPFSDSPDITIRGISTLSKGRARPLFIVDGVKREIFHLNSNNIKSISVLKDAAATAIYGVEGANGVILVTTKRGSRGPAKISLDMSGGVQQPVRQPKFVGSYRYATLYNQAQISDGTSPDNVRFTDEAINAFKTHSNPYIYPDMDWVDYLTHDVAFQTHNSVSVSGGGDFLKYFISAGYQRTNGLFKTFDTHSVFTHGDNPNYTKYNLRTNLDLDLTPTTRVSLTAYGRVGTHVRLGDIGNEWLTIYHGVPFSGNGLVPAERVGAPSDYDLTLSTGNSAEDNPYIPGQKVDPLKLYYQEGVNVYTRNLYNLDINVRQKLNFITKGLSARFKASYNSWYQKGKNEDQGEPEYSPYFKTDVDPSARGDSSIVWKQLYRSNPLSVSESYDKKRDWYMEAKINYSRNFGPHDISGLVLFNQRRKFYPSSYRGVPRGLVGLVGRVNYTYDQRYSLELNAGYNGSEKFAKGRRFGFFPSISGAWTVTNESFMENVHFLDMLKFSASYGIVGSDQGVGRFLYLPDQYYVHGGYGYNFGYHTPQNHDAAAETSIGNPYVSWATAKKQNYAVDMRLLSNRLELGVTYFREDRVNILSTLNTIPNYVNAPLPAVNLGEVKNNGFEAKIDWNGQIGNDFSYDVGGNVTFSRNKILEMNEVHQPEPYLYRTGHPVGQPFGYVFDRFYAKSDFESDGTLKSQYPQPSYQPKAGDLKYKDLNADGIIDAYDQRAIGYPNDPEYSFGVTIGFDYKNFSLSTLWQGVAHVSRNFGGSPYRTAFGLSGRGGYGTFKWQADGAWTPEKAENGEKITYPRLSTNTVSRRNGMDSDFWLKDGSYVRLKNAKISYTLPQRFFKGTRISNVNIYLNGYDLLTFSNLGKYSLDPERSATASGTVYPITKIYNFGVHFEF